MIFNTIITKQIGEIMKKILLALLAMFIGGLLMINNSQAADLKGKKVLVVYYSITGNTKAVAEEIKNATGGDIFELQTIQTYPSSYKEQTEQAKKEIQDGYKPDLKNDIDTNQYDVIFIGSPCWWGTYAPAVSTFLANHNLAGKTIVPFMTHGGSGLGRSVSDMKKAAQKSNVLNGLAIRGGSAQNSEREVKKFVDGLNLK